MRARLEPKGSSRVAGLQPLIKEEFLLHFAADPGRQATEDLPCRNSRPLRRVIQRELQNPLATMLLAGTVKDGDTLTIAIPDGRLSVNGNKLAQAA
jgi:hypothetical protein